MPEFHIIGVVKAKSVELSWGGGVKTNTLSSEKSWLEIWLVTGLAIPGAEDNLWFSRFCERETLTATSHLAPSQAIGYTCIWMQEYQ
jgi:hypothetical protein